MLQQENTNTQCFRGGNRAASKHHSISFSFLEGQLYAAVSHLCRQIQSIDRRKKKANIQLITMKKSKAISVKTIFGISS